jgi:hypothetical protein
MNRWAFITHAHRARADHPGAAATDIDDRHAPTGLGVTNVALQASFRAAGQVIEGDGLAGAANGVYRYTDAKNYFEDIRVDHAKLRTKSLNPLRSLSQIATG